MSDYKNSKIYFLLNNITNEIFYIGSTIRPLQKRFKEHQKRSMDQKYKEYHHKKYKYMRKYGISNISIYLLEECDCHCKYELLYREHHWIRLLKPSCNVIKSVEDELYYLY